MTDMLDLITLFAGIGIGWLMGRTLAKPQRGQEGTAARTAHRAAEGHACTHHWQDTGNPGTRYCARCGTEWTEAGA